MKDKLIQELMAVIESRTRQMWTAIKDLPQTSFASSGAALDAVSDLGMEADNIRKLRTALNVLMLEDKKKS